VPNVVNQESLGTIRLKSSLLSQLRVWTTVGQLSMLATKCLSAKLGFVTALEHFNVGSGSLHVAKLDVGGWRHEVDRNRGSKVIGDHFENLFSIYRRDFLKMIGDHFSFYTRTTDVARRSINLGTAIQFGKSTGSKE
jgi:hypothetical protein